MELIGQVRHPVKEGMKEWVEIELTFRVAGGSRGGPESIRIRIDPATNLPDSFTMVDEEGKSYRATIDYPDRGPADIYDLGAPHTAQVVDRFPPDDVRPVLARQKAARRAFDDYCGFVIEDIILPLSYFPRTTVYRVWRKGPKWRIERLRPEPNDWAPPADVTTAWWKEHQRDFVFVPAIICDGKVYWDYYLTDQWKPGMPVPKPAQPDRRIGQTVGPNTLMAPADDPVIPFWCQNVLPEQAGHPTMGIGEPDHNRAFLVEPQPGSGPPGTILLRGRDTSSVAPERPDWFRLWIDPVASDLVRRTEIRVSVPKDLTRVAFIDTHVAESAAQSPTGRWYPSRTRHSAHNGEHEIVRRFFIDFEAMVPDALFEPL
jgi:hypothetical protein